MYPLDERKEHTDLHIVVLDNCAHVCMLVFMSTQETPTHTYVHTPGLQMARLLPIA